MHQRRPADQRRVHPRDHERRRRDAAAHLQALAEALGERGLARPQVTGEHQQVAGPQQRRDAEAESVRVVRRRGDQLDGHETAAARPLVAAATSSSSTPLTRSLRSRITMWPAPGHSTSRESGDPRGHLAAVADGGEHVLRPADDVRRHVRELLERPELVERVEVREEPGEHLERRGREHVVDELDVGGGDVLAERELVGDQEADVGAAPADPVDELGGQRQAGHQPLPDLRADGVGDEPADDPVRVQPAGAGGDQRDTGHPLLNSSGWRSANAMIVMPPMECPTSTTSPVGTSSRSTTSRSSPSWSMVACCLSVWPDRPCERWS